MGCSWQGLIRHDNQADKVASEIIIGDDLGARNQTDGLDVGEGRRDWSGRSSDVTGCYIGVDIMTRRVEVVTWMPGQGVTWMPGQGVTWIHL